MSSVARRFLSATLKTSELSPEATAFLKERIPKPSVEKLAMVVIENRAANEAQSPEQEAQKPARQRSTTPNTAELVAVPGLVFASIRLPAEIPHALMRAAFDRKLKRQNPGTQQDIVAEALSLWLRKSGYL